MHMLYYFINVHKNHCYLEKKKKILKYNKLDLI